MTTSVSAFRRILTGTGVYSIPIVIGRIVSILMIPVYTRYLSVADYGTLELFELTLFVLSGLVGMRLGDVIAYFYANAESASDRPIVLSSAFVCAFALASLLTGFGILLAPQLMTAVVGDLTTVPLFRIMVLSYALSLPCEVANGYLRVINAAGMTVAFNVGRTLLVSLINVYLLVALDLGIAAMVFGSLIANATVTIGLLLVCWRSVSPRVSLPLIRRMMQYGAPLGFSGCGYLFVHYGDRFFLRRSLSLEQIGVYSLAYKLGMMVTYIQNPFETYWRSQMFHIMKQADGEAIYVRVATYLTLGVAYCCLGLQVFANPVLGVVVGPDYRPAAEYVGWIAIAYGCRTIAGHFRSVFLLENQTGKEAFVVSTSVFVCLLAYLVLIPPFGIWGAIAATNLAFVSMLAFSYVQAQQVRRFHFERKRIFHCVVMAFVLAACHGLCPNSTIALQFLSAGFVALTYPVALWVTGFLRIDELAFIRSSCIAARGRFISIAKLDF